MRKIPFSEVYDGRSRSPAVRGKIVVVGSTAPSLQDFHRTATSRDSTMAGAEIQADAIADRRWTASRCARLRAG